MNKKIILTLTVLCSYGLVQADPFTVVRRANRRFNAELVRNGAADRCVRQDLAAQPTNGDEERYEDLRGSYGKGLAQLPSGLVDPEAYESLVFALATGNSSDFDEITLDPTAVRKLHSPQAGFDFNLGGADSWIHSIAAPPALASAEKAGEMVELYEIALLRDFNLSYTGTPPITVTNAIAALNALSDFKGPKVAGMVDATTLFRSTVPGALAGPYISQFLFHNVPFFDGMFLQQYRVPNDTATAMNTVLDNKNNFLTNLTVWENIQKGQDPTNEIDYAGYRYIITPRDLASFVHNDPPQLPYIFALLILAGWAKNDPTVFNPNSPYIDNPTQTQFAEFFVPQFIGLLSQACDMALRAAWYQKWLVHRTIRPEVMGWLVDRQMNTVQGFTQLHNDVISSQALIDINALNNATSMDNTYLLPQVFPEGSPLHPAYPAGHATIGGAAVTILKAFFNEDFVITSSVVMKPTDDGSALNFAGLDLTVGGELNKLAANIAHGRNMAGVHYRSDAEESLRLGEAVALSLLEDFAYTMNIDFKGFSLTKFDGTKITVGTKKVMAGLPK